MGGRKMGVEEELLLIDPGTRQLTGLSGQAVAAHSAEVEVSQELFLQQIETSTPPCLTADDLAAGLRVGRRAVGEAAAAAGARAVATATHPLVHDAEDITPQGRYKRIEALGGETARQSLLCSMHVHVDIADDEEGVMVVDRVRPWLPVLLALSANSPYWRGRDTSYATWRSQLIHRWATAGPAEPFGGAKEYRDVTGLMQAWGAAPDPGMLYFDVRLSHHLPTVEVRVADVCTDVDDGVLLALLTRALVTCAADPFSPFAPVAPTPNTQTGATGTPTPWRSDLLRVATWRAARYGTGSTLVHPLTLELVPTRTVVEDLMRLLRPALEETDDTALVAELAERLLSGGNGATRQRRVLERSGDLTAVVDDLADRTEGSWLTS